MIKDKIEIGIATVEYNNDGTFKSSVFTPTLQSVISLDVFKMIDFKDKPIDDEQSIKEIADTSLASFYTEMSEIELADREEYEIVSEVQKDLCEKHGDIVLKCVLKYYFKKR